MKLFPIAILVILLTSAAYPAERIFTQQQSQDIIANGLWLRGYAERPSDSLADYLHQHENSEYPILKCGTSMLMDMKLVAAADRSAQASAMLANPRPDSLELTYDSPAGYFKIHYTKTGLSACYQPNVDSDGDGVPDYIESVATIADSVHNRIVNQMGYPAPPDDSFYPEGGDSRYDIYIRNLPSSIYGQTVPDSISLGIGPEAQRATSFMELDNDYQHVARYRDRPLDAVRVTMAHEYFHAVQFSIDYFEAELIPIGGGLVFVSRYWMEMSSVWMEEELYDNINDYYAYLPVFFNNPLTSLQSFKTVFDLHPYASAVFPIYLRERFGAPLIRDIWLRCGERGPGPDFLIAASEVINSATGGAHSWVSAFQEFTLWNYFTGTRAGNAPSGIGYSERANYPAIPENAIGRHFDYPVNVLNNNNAYRPEHNAAAYIRFEDVPNTMTRFWTCNSGPFAGGCTDSSEVFDTAGWDPFADINRIDTSFSVRLRYDTNGFSRPWGLAVVTQQHANPSIYDAERFVLPVTDTLNFATVETNGNSQNRSILYILSYGSEDLEMYTAGRDTVFLSYAVRENSTIDSSLIGVPSAILTPYPNPAVVARMSEREVKFRFQVQRDTLAAPLYTIPLMVVDVFTIAGEYVATISKETELRRGDPEYGEVYTLEWDMKNSSGADVASGAYIALARLYNDFRKTELLAEDKVKVAIIR